MYIKRFLQILLIGHEDEIFSCAFNYEGDIIITGFLLINTQVLRIIHVKFGEIQISNKNEHRVDYKCEIYLIFKLYIIFFTKFN
jgi:hypothetical protein